MEFFSNGLKIILYGTVARAHLRILSSGAGCLEGGDGRDPSLRLKSGYAQDDAGPSNRTTTRPAGKRRNSLAAKKSKSSLNGAAGTDWRERLRYFEAKQSQMVETIREFVEIESPSDNKAAA